MAANLQQLKKRIRTAQNIAQIAKAMEMIAASKIKKAQSAVEHNRPYAERITMVVEKIIENCDLSDYHHPCLRAPGEGAGKRLVIVAAPDKGLCGGLPSNLFRDLAKFDRAATAVVAVGKKAEKFAVRYEYRLLASFAMGTTFPRYNAIYPVLKVAREHYLSGAVDAVDVLFTSFKSMMIQAPASLRLLPVATVPKCSREDIHYIFEPGTTEILNELLPYYVETKLYNCLIQAYTSEQAARMVAMQSAKDNAMDITEFLTRSYNRSRQERITNEILDLANGRIAQNA